MNYLEKINNYQAKSRKYEVMIEPASFALGKGKNKCSIHLGIEGRADIITRENTVLKFLLRKAKLMTNF
jgi:hypothetical protein